MKLHQKMLVSATIVLSASLAVVGCGSTQSTTNVTSSLVSDDAAASLKVWGYWNDLKPIQDLVKKKFPNVTLESIGNSKETLQDVVTKQESPDIMFLNGASKIASLGQVGFNYNLTPLIQKYKLDLNGFDASAISNLKRYSAAGEIWALPQAKGHSVLLYNKNIFDKFGVSYPTDGMTWAQVIDLAKKVTKDNGGVHYYGLGLQDFSYIANEYPLLAVDPKTDKSTLASDAKWSDVFNLYKGAYFAGNDSLDMIKKGIDGLAVDQNVAMFVGNVGWFHVLGKTIYDGKNNFQPLSWDMVSVPTLSQSQQQIPAYDIAEYSVSSQSPNKEMAFKVIAYLTTSPDVINYFASNPPEPIPSSFNTPDQVKQFAANDPDLNGKNVKAVFYGKAAVWPNEVSQYEYLAAPIIKNDINQILSGTDVNTVLRKADEDINKAIDTAKLQK